jgi:hypothetical protein
VVTETAWETYADALVELHRQRRRIAREDADWRSGRVAVVEQVGEQLSVQQQRLADLARQLRVDPMPAAIGPGAPAALGATQDRDTTRPGTSAAGPASPAPEGGRDAGWEERNADLGRWLAQADRAADQARSVAALPQLLPGWDSPLARDAVVYGLLALPNAVLTVGLSLLDVHGNAPLLWWYVLIFPVLAAIAGGHLIGRWCAPRTSPAALEQGRDEPGEAPRHRHRWLGVIFAWASWLVPGTGLDLLAQLHR